MKNIIAGFVMALAAISSANTAELVKTCLLADGMSSKVNVTREHRISDTYVYKLQYLGKTEYFFENEEGSRGSPVKVICAAGKTRRALIAYGEFTANYSQGFALTYDHSTDKIERLDFAEKGGPESLYLGTNDFFVILPTYGVGENGTTPYVAYRHINGKAQQPEPQGVEVPTPPVGYDVIKLKQ